VRDFLRRTWAKARVWQQASLRASEGVALVEFTVTLPLMVVLIVGTFDFGAAFNVKQKLNAAAREGARFAANSPANDLVDGAPTPNSVKAARDVVVNYLKAEGINDCGVGTRAGTPGAGMKWTFQASGSGCPPLTFSLSIERSFGLPASAAGTTINVISTRVNITYPYAWHFGHVVGLLTPGSTFAGVSLISADAIVPNMD
jgi:Flp pilus assembly protein TadG